MDPMENGLFDIPDYDGIDDEAFPPLPPPHSPGRGGQEEGDPFADGEEDGDVSKLAEVPAAKKRVVKRPQPKLDSQRLVSERGLPALRTLFDNVSFKGKGHEASDLQLLMQKMENWAHRLYPKLQFEDFIDKVEKLGNKKEVQTCLKRIRLDMPLTHEDFMGKDGEEEAAPELQVFGEPDPFSRAIFPDDVQGPVHSTPAPSAPSAPSAPAAPSPAAPSLTEEQRCRMELNRQRALEKRLARQQQQEQQEMDPPDPQTVDTPPDPQTGDIPPDSQTVDTPPDSQTVDTPPDSQTVDTPTSSDEPASVSSANILDGSEDQVEPAEDSDPEPVGSSTQ